MLHFTFVFYFYEHLLSYDTVEVIPMELLEMRGIRRVIFLSNKRVQRVVRFY